MTGLVDLLLGPLAGLECRRALLRWWVWGARLLIAVVAAGAVLLVGFICWVANRYDESFPLATLLAGALLVLQFSAVTIALVLSPALLAGTLSGERARGTMLLLLTSHVTPREIVCGRMAGRLAVVLSLLAAGVPALAVMSGANSMPPAALLTMVLLPVSVAVGAGGLATAASATAHRGRDALLAVYLLMVVLLLAPLFTAGWVAPEWGRWIVALNPLTPLMRVSWTAATDAMWRSILLWLAMGTAGTAWGTLRLRPVYLGQLAGRKSRHGPRRLRRAPPMKDRPMLWKELYVEQIGALNPLVRWIGALVIAVLLGGSLVLGSTLIYYRWIEPDVGWATWAQFELQTWVQFTALPITWLIQWAVGLRAAVAIASERERATWDALVASPLEGREIVVAKLLGSLRALRGLILAATVAWTLPVLLGAIDLATYVGLVAGAVCVSAFMVVVGVWCSLTNRTAGGAMTMTLLAWLVSALGVMILAAVTTAIGAMIVRSAWYTWQAANNISPRGNPPYPFSFATGWTISQDVIYAVLALVGALYLRRRFDELAGRTPPLRRVRLPVHDQPVVATLPPPPRWVQQPLGTKPPRRTAVAQGVAVGESHANTQRARDFWSRR